MDLENWIKVTIRTTHEGIEPVTGRLYQAGVAGTEIEDEQDFNEFFNDNRRYWDYIDESLVNKMSQGTKIITYVSNNEKGMQQLNIIRESISKLKHLDAENRFGALEITVENLSEEDWANNWKQYFKPIPIGNKMLVKPVWEDFAEDNSGRTVLNIDPGMVFGTGAHETTRLCIQAAEKYVKAGDTILDLGCGSGILSITALLLGADNAIAIDIDPNAKDIAYANAKLNGIGSDIYKVLIGDFITDMDLKQEIGCNRYDVIFANIVADVIIAATPSVKKQLKKNGIFIASGIIDERSTEVRELLLNCGFDIIKINEENGWISIICKHK